MKLDETEFKRQFVAAFIGSWCSKHYENDCENGAHSHTENPPVEDALYLADKAWEKYMALSLCDRS
jgi:hypothetical protein